MAPPSPERRKPDVKVCALVPVFNEAEHIRDVVRGCTRHCRVVAIDDGSEDDSARLAAEAGAAVLRQASNAGKGMALRIGFALALEAGCDFLLACNDRAGAVSLLDGLDQSHRSEGESMLSRCEGDWRRLEKSARWQLCKRSVEGFVERN